MSKLENKERITFKYVWDSMRAILNLEKGVPHTFVQFLYNQDTATQRFLFKDRDSFVNPLKYIFISVAFYAFLFLYFIDVTGGLDERIRIEGLDPQAIIMFGNIFNKYYNLFMLFGVPFSAFFTYLFFKEKEWYYMEHLVLNLFVYGTLTFLSIPLLVFYFFGANAGNGMVMIAGTVYIVLSYKKIFAVDWITAIWKSLLINFLTITIYTPLILFGIAIYVGYALSVQ